MLPAYNEESAIVSLLDKIASCSTKWGFTIKVLIVDDGSSDRTVELAEAHALKAVGALEVVKHGVNRGLADAMRTGIETFLKRATDQGDIMVTMDADDTHDPVYIAGLVEEIRNGADVAICSRFVEGGVEKGVNAFRKILSRGAKWFMDVLAPIPLIKDISCGYRGYSAGILEKADRIFGAHLIQSPGASVQAELLVRLMAIGAKIKEIPFVLRYDLKQGPSKIGMAKTIKGYFLLRTIKKVSAMESELAAGWPETSPDATGIAAMLCTYNEAENIEPIIERIYQFLPGGAVIVVDDNSPDGTGDIAEKLKDRHDTLNVLHREGKLGLASATTEGLKWARENGFTAVINMDADFSHDPVMLPEFVEKGKTADFVIGSRYMTGGCNLNWGVHRYLLSKGGNMFAKIMLGMPVYEHTTSFRYIRLEHLDALKLDSVDTRGYGFLISMIFHAVNEGLRVVEIPIRFLDRRYGISKMSVGNLHETFLLVLRLRKNKKG